MKIICVGRNYVDHIEELKNVVLAEPAIFLKPETAWLPAGNDFIHPEFSDNIHHEIELVLRIGKTGKHVSEENAIQYVDAISVGIDFTARDIQDKLKEKRLSWELSKAFDQSASTGDFIPVTDEMLNSVLDFYLLKDNVKVQQGTSNEMIFNFQKIISFVSNYFTLETGDLIFTGTPAGVGPVRKGQVLEGYLNNKQLFKLSVI